MKLSSKVINEVTLLVVGRMSSKTNQSLSGKCAHLFEVKCSLALSLCRLYLRKKNRGANA